MKIIARIVAWLRSRRNRLGQTLAYQVWSRNGYVPIAGGTDVAGARTTGNIEANILEPDFADIVAELEPSANPLTVLSRRLNKDSCINPKFTWFEDKLQARFDQINNGGGYTSSATSLVVDNGAYWATDDLLYVTRTGEVIRVVTVSGNTLSVVIRGIGSTAAALLDDDEIIRVSSSAAENALDKPARSDNPIEVFNYTQIFRTPVELSRTARQTANRVRPNDWNRQLNHAGIEHNKDIEYAALLGTPSLNATGPRRTTAGFSYYANQNVTDVGGQMTEPEFFAALRPMFRYGSGTKLALCAAAPVDIINAFPRAKLQIAQGEEQYGLRVMQVISPHGNLNLVTHWLLEGSVFSQQIWVVDLANAGYRYLHGDDGSADTSVLPNRQAPGQDGRKDEYLTECGFKFAQPLTHGKIVNITS